MILSTIIPHLVQITSTFKNMLTCIIKIKFIKKNYLKWKNMTKQENCNRKNQDSLEIKVKLTINKNPILQQKETWFKKNLLLDQ